MSDPSSSSAVLDAAGLAPFPELEDLERRVVAGEPTSAGNLWGSAQALVLASLAGRSALAQSPFLVVLSAEAEAEAFVEDLRVFGLDATFLPARESTSGSHADAGTIRSRLQVAQRLIGPPEGRPRVLVASILSLLQPIPAVRELEREFLALEVGQVLDAEKLLRRLVSTGYERQPLAEEPGEVSLRGDILDLYPYASDWPIRIELFEDEIESLRTFDPADQRSIDSTRAIEVCLAADAGGIRGGEGIQVGELLDATAVVVEIEPLRVEERAEGLRIQSPDHERALRTFTAAVGARRRLALQSLPGHDVSLDTRSVHGLEVGMRQAAEALRGALADGSRVVVLCHGDADEKRFREVIAEQGGATGYETRIGTIARGFRIPPWRLVVVNHHELKGMLGVRRRAKGKVAAHKVRAIQSFFELKPGDHVVHAVHGLAKFVGLKRVERGGGEEEHLELRFAGDVSLFVPSSRIDMVQRYIGTGGSGAAPLDKIGGTTFRKRKEKVERGLFDLAAELIDVQAKRALRERPGWRGDAELVRELVESFEYEDTEDQKTVDKDIETDLRSEKPMDRLLCGDVGFGKTELAVRAAFRVVAGGGQVAIAVPTTVLAQQHFEVFRARLADFPVRVEMVSRYVGAKDVKATLAAVEEGAVDVLVGTHRIFSQDVQFKNLGLVIIDEEQRFGVQHKEHFKKLRATVDLLTLTATPIPRTLHMSLSGIRDISALTVPPPGRQDIETILAYTDDDELIREAVLREKNRGGQVFFLHNRVSSIVQAARRVQELVPQCTYSIGHGQMSAKDLRQVMESFTHGEADVLVATTIVENGLDIPSAGTILIDDADHFGLSELHQLRGRVGRGAHKAHCYLLVERHKPLKDIASQRLKALEELNQLGAGFGISIKDLELRGAGNVLGAQQSGHIAAVGYDMYCRLLKLTIERIQSGESYDKDAPRREETEAGVELELGIRAYLPDSWIETAEARIELLRELSLIAGPEDAEKAEASLRDRYGRVPDEARALVRVFRLKALLDPYELRRVAWHGGAYTIQYTDRVAFERLFGGLDVDLRRIRRGVAHLVVPEGVTSPPAALDWLEGLLQRVGHPERMPAGDAT